MSVSYIDRQTLAAIAPSVTKALTINNTQYGWLLSAFSMAYFVCSPVAGALVDRLGARRGFAAAVVVWSLVAGAHALASSFATLFLLRVLLGIAEAPSFPAAAQAIRRALPGGRRPLAFGLLFTGSSIGAIVAAKLAIRLDATYGFRGAFAGTALIGALWIPLWLAATRNLEERGGANARDGSRSLDERNQDSTSLPERVSWLEVMKNPAVLRAIVAIVGSAPALMFVLNWTSKYLVDDWSMPKDRVGNYLVVPPLLFDAGAIGFGALASRRPAQTVFGPTHTDLVVVAMLLASTLALAPFARSPEVAIAIASLSACGGGGLYALVTADMLARVPASRASTASGMTAAAQSLAIIVASPLVGWTIDRTHGHGAALVGLGVVVVPTTLAFLAWPSVSGARVTGEQAAEIK